MTEDQTIRTALTILETRLQDTDAAIRSPEDAHAYLVLRLAERQSEVFGALFLNTRHGVIEYRELFNGTIDGTSVYPREVIRACIETNAAALILFHNHPSGVAEPSQADERITRRLSSACELIDVRVLDHIIVGGVNTVSFAARGLL